MRFYDLIIKHLKIDGLINSIFKLSNDENKAGVEFFTENTLNKPFIGYDKNNNELVGSNDGVNYFPLYNGDGAPTIIEKFSVNGLIELQKEDGFPVGIIAPNNVVIPTQKETIIFNGNNYSIKLSAYISYAGLNDDSGIWKVCVASGGKGSKGDPGESLNLEIGTVTSGVSPNVTLSGNSPNQILNFVLPAFSNNFEIVKEASNNTISVSSNAIPVMIKTSNNKYYNIRGREITLNNNKTKYLIDITNALAVNNTPSFSGEWEVYFSGSAKQISNISFSPTTNNVCTLNSSNSEITLNSYFIETNFINIYNKSETSGDFVIKVFVDDIEIQTNVLQSSNYIIKNTIKFNSNITGNVKIIRDYENPLDVIEDVNIYKIEG